ncbi:MAG: hypothetical protein ACE5HP_02825 [Gemmatimonadota bacterium]
MRADLGAVALLLGAGACATGGEGEPVCRPGEARGGEEVRAAALAGRYELTLVTTSGERAGMAATGTLVLTEMPEGMRAVRAPGGETLEGVTAPLLGTLALDLESVGATVAGSTDATDPEGPGVLVLESAPNAPAGTRPGVTIRFGSVANDRRQTRFDGAYTALFVRRTAERGFFGSWASGVRREEAAGHFCALRASRTPR